ncbi:MAG: hypothetical protein HKM87_02120 [Ignavibacteriaceae bacterium]|nr:hypothetical protein [Ignavibacteriaceae bacterium]
MKRLTFFLVLIFIITSCSDKTEIPESGVVDGNMLQSLVNEAVSGSLGANRLLSGLIDDDVSERRDYNQVKIDSFYLDGRTFFSVIVEYPNPALNLFAVYDQYLKFYLLDESLNGNITAKWKKLDDNNLIIVSEKFRSKDRLKLERLSIYYVDGLSAELRFRTLNMFKKDRKEYFQTVTSFSDEYIITTIAGSSQEGLTSRRDTFYCNTISGDFLSPNNYFSSFVKNQIINYNYEPEDPQLISITETTRMPRIVKDKKGFRIGASKDWKEINNFVARRDLKKSFAGYSYINKSLGATLSVIKLPDGSFAEQFLDVKFGEASGYTYIIRATELFGRGRKYFQYLEHNCRGKRYLLIFEAPKHSYQENKIVYDTIIKSFRIDC